VLRVRDPAGFDSEGSHVPKISALPIPAAEGFVFAEAPPTDRIRRKDKGVSKLVQIHHQFKDGATRFCRQSECASLAELRDLLKEVMLDTPLPEGAQWLFCHEGAKQFLMIPEIDRKGRN